MHSNIHFEVVDVLIVQTECLQIFQSCQASNIGNKCETTVADLSSEISESCVKFLVKKEALKPYEEHVEQINKSIDVLVENKIDGQSKLFGRNKYMNSVIFEGDIKNIRGKDLKPVNVLCGGFPCQPFSISGNQGGFEDARGTLLHEILRIARHHQPSVLFLENVKN